MEAPVGGVPIKENTRVSSAPFMTSSSEAVTVNARDSSSLTLLAPTGSSTGATFISATSTVIASESLPPLPSDTCIVMSCVPSCTSVGVHENAPPDVMDAPVGAPVPSVNVRVSPASSSDAVAVKESAASSVTLLSPDGCKHGDRVGRGRRAGHRNGIDGA